MTDFDLWQEEATDLRDTSLSVAQNAMALDHEFLILCACCRPVAHAGRAEAIARAALSSFDPDRLLELAHAHRVEALVEQGLAAAGIALPDTAARKLALSANRARLQMLRNAGEEIRLTKLMHDAGIDTIFLKGATLGVLSHRNISLKTSWDIDILVARDDIDKAIIILSEAGYEISDILLSQLGLVNKFANNVRESAWISHQRGTTVELHWGLVSNPRILTGISIGSARQHVAITNGQMVPTLATLDLFCFLAVHGTVHAWARLKWLADIAGFFHNHADDLTDILAHAERANALRCAKVALLLMHRLLGVPLAPQLATAIASDRRANQLANFSVCTMATTDQQASTHDSSVRHRLGLHALHMTMAPGVRAMASHVWAKLNEPQTPRRLRLPRWLRAVDALIIGIPAAVIRIGILKLRQSAR